MTNKKRSDANTKSISKQTTLSVLVPVFNEKFLVAHSLSRLTVLAASPLLKKIKVIVVDDGSTDGTRDVLKDFQANFVKKKSPSKIEWVFLRLPQNKGKGAAINAALEYSDNEISVIHDADLEYHPEDILKMIPLFLDEGADAVYGSRFLTGDFKRVLYYKHELGNRFLTFLCNLITNINFSDMETCYKAVRTELFRSIPLVSSDFQFEPELSIKLAKRGACLFEVPIRYSGRGYQEGKKINYIDGLKAIIAIIKFGFSSNIYKEDEAGGQILSILNQAPKFNQWMVDTIMPYIGENVLEIGAGIGNITVKVLPREQYHATDVNAYYLNLLHNISENKPYLKVNYLDINKAFSPVLKEKYDTVICLNVFEHIKDDAAAMANLTKILQPNGLAIILVPHKPELYGSFDKVLGHYRRYTNESLTLLAKKAGLKIDRIIEFNHFGTIGWWLNGKILKKKEFSLFQIKLLNWLIPIVRKIDRFLPFPPLSLIAVFKRG